MAEKLSTSTRGKIYPVMCGGLGNQLFQLAGMMGIAKWHDLVPVVPKIAESPSVFKNRPVYWDTMLALVPTVDALDSQSVAWEDLTEGDPQRIVNLSLSGKHIRLHGYFQNIAYFEHVREDLLKLLVLPKEHPLQQHIQTLYDAIVPLSTTPPPGGNDLASTKTIRVMMHIRRGDYLALAHCHTNLSMSGYYQPAMQWMQQHLREESADANQQVLFCIFSDDIGWCRENFGTQSSQGVGTRCYFVESQPWLDESSGTVYPRDVVELNLMTHFDAYILANSSFSWMGWWLNADALEKPVVAPQKWFEQQPSTLNMASFHLL